MGSRFFDSIKSGVKLSTVGAAVGVFDVTVGGVVLNLATSRKINLLDNSIIALIGESILNGSVGLMVGACLGEIELSAVISDLTTIDEDFEVWREKLNYRSSSIVLFSFGEIIGVIMGYFIYSKQFERDDMSQVDFGDVMLTSLIGYSIAISLFIAGVVGYGCTKAHFRNRSEDVESSVSMQAV